MKSIAQYLILFKRDQ